MVVLASNLPGSERKVRENGTMPSSAAHPVGVPFQRNPLLKRLAAIYLAIWLWSAIAPVSRSTWWMENMLVFVGLALLVWIHRRFVFSRLSYVLIFVFLSLHSVGTHYTYSAVPAGAWLAEPLGLARNPYDRFVHFMFGLLLTYPFRELALRVMHVHRVWSYIVPVLIILALSSFYEIIESWAAQLTAPETGLAFVGAQGDIWDGQKDMTLAFAGAILAMAMTALYRVRTQHEPYHGG
jgi:putative membrane protein